MFFMRVEGTGCFFVVLISCLMFVLTSKRGDLLRVDLPAWRTSEPRSPSPPASSLPPPALETLEVSSRLNFQFVGKAPRRTFRIRDEKGQHLAETDFETDG